MNFKVVDVEVWSRHVRTRLPFQFGISVLESCVHLYVAVTVEDEHGRTSRGIGADHIVPKWFEKNPNKAYDEELKDHADMLERVASVSLDHGWASPFRLWLDLYDDIHHAAGQRGVPPLVAGFALSLVERGLIDAVGRLLHLDFQSMIVRNVLGVDLNAVDGNLAGVPLAALVPGSRSHLLVRHTVGLADAIEERDITADERVDDGLPQSLEAVIDTYNVRYFKVKVSNHLDADLDRLRRVARLLERKCADGYACTLDGNEQYERLDDLQQLLQAMSGLPDLRQFVSSIVWVEQPFHRTVALNADMSRVLRGITQTFPVIIDESDARLGDFDRAVDLGYSGTSHKNCKGVFRSLVNAARCDGRSDAVGRPLFLSAEDLTTTGPISLEADLEVAAALGLSHVERNGHHYFRGLAHLDPEEQAAVRKAHPTLYTERNGIAALRIKRGSIAVDSLRNAPGLGGAHTPFTRGWQEGLSPLRDGAVSRDVMNGMKV